MSRNRRTRDAAFVLPVVMLLLLMPPYLQVFDQQSFLAGIPLLHVYIFSVWLAGIVVTAWLSRRMVMTSDTNVSASPGPNTTDPAER